MESKAKNQQVYLEIRRTSTMELFPKTNPVFAVNYFCEKNPS